MNKSKSKIINKIKYVFKKTKRMSCYYIKKELYCNNFI